MLELAIRHSRIDQQTIKDLPTTLAVHSAAILGLAIRRSSMDQQTIKDLRTALAVHPAAMIEDSIRQSRTYEHTCKHGPTDVRGIRKALREGVHICHAHW